MTELFADHAQELRYRILWSLAVFVVGCGLAFLFSADLTSWLEAPLRGAPEFTHTQSTIGLITEISLLGGFLLATPAFILNTVLFLRPIIPRPIERESLVKLSAVSVLVLFAGFGLAYYALLPLVIAVLSGTIIHHLHPLISTQTYLSFVMNFLAVVAVSLQLPVLVLFLDRAMSVNAELLENWRKWLFLSLFAAAIILPIAPDPISQVALAIPVAASYQITIWLLLLNHRTNIKVPTAPHPGPQRLPLAIAVPHQPRAASGRIVDPLRAPKSKTIDLREP
jgi:sec-independent protein translocase protein TatC